MTKKEQLQKALDESLDASNGKATPDLLAKILNGTTTDTTLTEINLRLKQLVALKVLESVAEGHNLFTDYSDDSDEAWDLERDLTDEARQRYQQEYRDATEALDNLIEKRGK